jgi:bacterioferritin (cytochrome b1)
MGLSEIDIKAIASATAEKVLQDLRHYALQYKDPFTVLDGLMDSMTEEDRAVVWYRSRAANARQKQDPTTAELYEHIAKEEEQHHQEFKERLGIILGLKHG